MNGASPNGAAPPGPHGGEHALVLPVLGIPVRFELDDGAVAEIAEASFGGWRVLESTPHLIAAEDVVVRVTIIEGDEGGRGHAPLRYFLPDRARVLIATPGSSAVVDGLRRETILHVTRDLVGDREHFRYGVLEAGTLALLAQLDRIPVHAAAIVRGEVALLLAAPSGVGKSTLAYAAARAGLAVLAEDLVYVQTRPELRVWGLPGWLHLPDGAAAHFPELSEARAMLLANGKRKIAVRTAALGALPRLPVARRAGVCLLRRDGGATSVAPIAPEVVAAELGRTPEPGFDTYAEDAGAPVRQLAAQGGWLLNIGSPPADIVPLLHRMFDELDAAEPT